MKVVFIGTVDFSLSILTKLVEMECDIVGVCTKRKSSFNTDYADLSEVSKKNKIPLHYTSNINSVQSVDWVQSLKPDIIFCFGWSSILGKEILSIPPMGVLGYHPAKLPENRGRHPIIWALILGLRKSASTYFFMDEGADSGDILSQTEFEISDDDNASMLYEKVKKCALKQLEEFMPLLETKNYVRVKQDESIATSWRKRGQRDGIIDFRMSSQAIYNLVRGLTKPYIGAHLVYKENEVTIWKAEISHDEKRTNIEPGKVLGEKGGVVTIKTGDGAIKLLEHEFRNLPMKGEYL